MLTFAIFFFVFDAGTREVCLTNRISTNTPLQALITMNDPVYVEASYHLAKSQLENENIEDAIKSIYKKATYKNINNFKLKSLVELYNSAIKQYENDPKSLNEFLNIEDTMRATLEELDDYGVKGEIEIGRAHV